ncbi:MAG: hypothetical protein AAGC96_03600 [Pseudomonadota bacterium]
MSNIAMKSVSRFVSAATIIVTLGGLPALAQTRELIFDVFLPRAAPIYQVAIVDFIKEVEDATAGSVKMTVPTSPMGPPPRLFDMVEDGVADLALAPIIYSGDRITLPLINDIFALAKTAETASVATWRTHKKFFEEAGEWEAVVPVAIFAHGDEQFFVKGREINSVADLDGAKMVSPSKLHAARIQALGGVPVGAPAIKMFDLINGGVAEGIIVPTGPAYLQGLVDVVDSTTRVPGGVARPAFAVIMNREVFESLSNHQQQAILNAGGEKFAAKLGAIAQREVTIGEAEFDRSGTKVIEASPELIEELRGKLGFIEQEWLEKAKAAGIDGPAALAYYRSVVAEMEAN